MTVTQLIKRLTALPPNLEVITDMYSEYDLIRTVSVQVGYERGGYISAPYDPKGHARAHDYVYLGTEGI